MYFSFVKLIYLLVLHFIADWAIQSPEMGRDKSKSYFVFLHHMWHHFAVFFIGVGLLFDINIAIIVSTLNVLLHGFIDFFIWRLYRVFVLARHYPMIQCYGRIYTMEHLEKRFKYWKDHWFGVFLGADQCLHFASLILITAIVWR